MPETFTSSNFGFGGGWTDEKLQYLKAYLEAYVKVMKNQPYFRTFYVDAFAGTGYNTAKAKKVSIASNLLNMFEDDSSMSNLSELVEADTQNFLKGSATIALEVTPNFDKYIFVEKDQARFTELQQLKTQYSHLQASIEPVNEDANTYIKRFCKNMDRNDRAVLFLDPFGMQVPWETVEAIADTKKIDLWYLFPAGMGVMRMLENGGNIPESWKQSLDKVFGTDEWFGEFYHRPSYKQQNMFDDSDSWVKDASIETIRSFLVKRLETIFPGVVEQPPILRNTKNSPLYIFCFAVGNEKGSKIALRIANSIFKPKKPKNK
jgi:three-Cys-motif partner protein